MPANRNVTSVETYSGQYVDLINPDPATIKLVDIAMGLAHTARFAGQTTRFYSVAEHAVRVSRLVPRALALPALHHDSHEAYIGDIIAPLKAALRQLGADDAINKIANRLDAAIAVALVEPMHPTFGEYYGRQFIEMVHTATVKAADDEVMYREAAALKWSHGVGEHWLNDAPYESWPDIGWSPGRALRKFIERHEELTG